MKNNQLVMITRVQGVLLLMLFINSWPALGNIPSKWAIHGFAAQGLIKAADSNFVNDEGDSSFELTELGLNGSYQWRSNLRIAAQVVYLNGGNRYDDGSRLDFLLLNWDVASTPDWQLRLYLGRFKNLHRLYSSTLDVPHTRPSIILPQSVYFDANRDMALGTDGIGLSYSKLTTVGEFDFFWSYGESSFPHDAGHVLFTQQEDEATENMNAHDMHEHDPTHLMHQASLLFRPQLSNWQYGISLLDTDIDVERVMFNLKYSGERWELATEIFQERTPPNLLLANKPGALQRSRGGYVQGRYLIDERLSLMLRYDRFYANKDDHNGSELEKSSGGLVPAYFSYMNDTTVGFTYRLASNWRLQGEYHWLEGSARLPSIVISDGHAHNHNHRYSSMWAIQLMYWF